MLISELLSNYLGLIVFAQNTISQAYVVNCYEITGRSPMDGLPQAVVANLERIGFSTVKFTFYSTRKNSRRQNKGTLKKCALICHKIGGMFII